MRTLAIVVVGLVSGIIGAVSVSALGGTTASPVATAPRSTPEARNRSDVLRGVVPPGWDARYVKRAPATPSLRDERDEVGRADPSDPSAMCAAREAEPLASSSASSPTTSARAWTPRGRARSSSGSSARSRANP